MTNPWVNLPLADYEGHMKWRGVAQLDVLSELFGQAIALRRPGSVAILGVAGGNGLERVDASVTRRVVGVDINSNYLETVRQRYPGLNLELYCADLADAELRVEPVDLVHAALVFEHAGVSRSVDNALGLVKAGGALSVVVQLPSVSVGEVSETPFAAMQTVKGHFVLVDQGWLTGELQRRELRLLSETTRSLPGGKAFWMGVFEKK